jgi:hypothetical protein
MLRGCDGSFVAVMHLRKGQEGEIMTVKHVSRALPAIVLIVGLAAIVPTNAQVPLPAEESAEITVAGCLQRGGSNGEKFVLASPRVGSAVNLSANMCTATVDAGSLELEHAHRHGIDDSMVGRFIEVSGRLEKETNASRENLRELYVSAFRVAGAAAEWARDASLLPPDESGVITVAGCLRAGPNHGSDDGYVLATPRRGPIAGVPEGKCIGAIDDRAVELDHSVTRGIDDSMLGRWIEVTGKLEKETSDDPDNLREMYVDSFRMVPVIPRRAEAASTIVSPEQAEQQPATPPAETMARMEESAVEATASFRALPNTATGLPAIGLLGLLSLGAGLVLHFRG